MTTILESLRAETHREVGKRDTAVHSEPPIYRLHYFDWLRALSVFGVVLYHALLPFARDTWNLVNDQQSASL